MKPAMRTLMFDRLAHSDQQPRSEYGGGTDRRMIGYDRDGPHMTGGERPGMAYGWPHPPMGGHDMPESRRRRDKMGRFAMGGMDYDEDDEPRGYRPEMMAKGGNSYGDIYTRGTIYAPGAMNRPGGMSGDMSQPVDEHTARRWVREMDGGEHFDAETAERHRATICPHCDKWEYYTAINAMYSDYCETAKKMGMDKPEFYAHLAKDFLTDKDAGPHKLRKYMETIPK